MDVYPGFAPPPLSFPISWNFNYSFRKDRYGNCAFLLVNLGDSYSWYAKCTFMEENYIYLFCIVLPRYPTYKRVKCSLMEEK